MVNVDTQSSSATEEASGQTPGDPGGKSSGKSTTKATGKAGSKANSRNKKGHRKSHEDINAEILRALNLREEFAELGIQFSKDRPNPNGWLECYAADRDERKPSAAVNLRTGYYIDSAGSPGGISLWDFAVTRGRFADWQDAREHYRQKAGVEIGADADSKKDPNDDFLWQPWDDFAAAMWARHKKGVTVEALRAAGARLAMYPKEHPRYPVIALPVYGPKLINAPPVNWVFWCRTGAELPVWDWKTKTVERTVKMKCCYGASSGLMGLHALTRLATRQEGQEPPEMVWKVAGPTDMLAMWSMIPVELREKHLVITNSNGEGESVKPEWVRLLAGLRVMVVHDADNAGEIGAAKWFEALKPVATEVRQVRLPFLMKENHGKDLRDFVADGLGGIEIPR
jgi:hypothetical protein